MARTAHLESAFEGEIVAHLISHGWREGDRTAYRRALGLDVGELLGFVRETQPEAWEKLSPTSTRRTRTPSATP